MTDRVLCRYFMHGTCKKGDTCAFSHDWKDQASTVCTFFQRGICSFGNRCRYDHVKLPKPGKLAEDSQSAPTNSIGNCIPNKEQHKLPIMESTSKASFEKPSHLQDETFPQDYSSYSAPSNTLIGEELGRQTRNMTSNASSYQDWAERVLPESLSMPYDKDHLQWQDNSIEEFDEGLPDVRHDSSMFLPSDSYYEFQEDAATFSYQGSAIRMGLSQLSLSNHQFPSHLTPDRNGQLFNEHTSDFQNQYSHSLSQSLPENPFNLNPQADMAYSAPEHLPAWQQSSSSANHSAGSFFEQSGKRAEEYKTPEDRPLCEAFTVKGECPHAARCLSVHGMICGSCLKYCLHPFRPEEAEEHRKTCERSQKLLLSLRRSQDIECGVCLEKVLSKPKVSERKFGVLSGCDHAFCIACIRGWRGGTHSTAGMDLDRVVRACPICRVQSHFVTPSVVWFFSEGDKEEIVAGYKKKLNDVDCKYFDYGEGNCPFGTSCFYKHAYRDGTREEVKLRHLGAADGSTVIAKDVRLSDFLSPVFGRR